MRIRDLEVSRSSSPAADQFSEGKPDRASGDNMLSHRL